MLTAKNFNPTIPLHDYNNELIIMKVILFLLKVINGKAWLVWAYLHVMRLPIFEFCHRFNLIFNYWLLLSIIMII